MLIKIAPDFFAPEAAPGDAFEIVSTGVVCEGGAEETFHTFLVDRETRDLRVISEGSRFFLGLEYVEGE